MLDAVTSSDLVTISITLFAFFSSIGLFVICSVASGTIMYSKGRSKFIGQVLGLVFGPIGLLICFCLPTDEEEAAKRLIASGRKRRCNECGSLVDAKLKECPFCSYAKAVIEQLRQVIENRKM